MEFPLHHPATEIPVTTASVVGALSAIAVNMSPVSNEHRQFLELLESHQRALLKVCWAYGRKAHDREDLLQEIVSRLWGSFRNYDRRRRFSTWMYRVALNVAMDFCRRQSRWNRETPSGDPTELFGGLSSDTDDLRNQQLLELREMLEQLDEPDRGLLLLHLEGHTHREVGDILGVSETSVGTRLSRLRQSLKKTVENSSIQSKAATHDSR